MKLNQFFSVFSETGRETFYAQQYNEVGSSALLNLPELNELLSKYSGLILEEGLFKIHNKGSFYLWTEISFKYFKKYKGNSYCFAFDWIGRQYAINYNNGKKLVLMLDPATAKVFELESDIESFLNEDVDEFKAGVLEFDKFNAYIKFINSKIKFNECLGFINPLFLGGKDELRNIEVIDIEVYWELNHQIYLKTRNLPPGTKVNTKIKDS